MPEVKSDNNKFKAIIIDPKTDKYLAKLYLDGETFPSNEWINIQGNLQSFEILDENKGLWEAWVDQRDVILRTEHTQRIVKITTYPAEGENHGFLNFISEVKDYQSHQPNPGPQSSPKKKLTFLRSLFGV